MPGLAIVIIPEEVRQPAAWTGRNHLKASSFAEATLDEGRGPEDRPGRNAGPRRPKSRLAQSVLTARHCGPLQSQDFRKGIASRRI